MKRRTELTKQCDQSTQKCDILDGTKQTVQIIDLVNAMTCTDHDHLINIQMQRLAIGPFTFSGGQNVHIIVIVN